ncbi:MAG: endo-1,4-beta-xylanase, partial [Methanothermobacter tenebrarum]
DLTNPDAPIPQFVNAMEMAGIEVTGEQVLEVLKDPENFQLKIDNNGKKYVDSVYMITQDGVRYSMGITYEEASGWKIINLKNTANRINFNIGSSIEGYSSVTGKASFYIQEFNQALLDADLEWFNTEPTRGQPIPQARRNKIDRAIEIASQMGNTTIGSNLIFWGGYPDWLKNGKFSDEELREIVKNRIITIISYLQGKVSVWIVLNSFHPARWGGIHDPLRDQLGDELIDIAFQTARDADPSAILIYNDTRNHSLNPNSENGSVTANTMRIVNHLKQKGLIDGVGLQMHLDGNNPPTKQEVIKAMRSYGLPIYVTEFDVDMTNVGGNKQQKAAKQARIFQEMIEACLESGVCVSFTQFTPGDSDSWLGAAAEATAFDSNLNPKPAYYALLAALINAARTNK